MLPQFQVYESIKAHQGSRLYGWSAPPNVTFFIALIIDTKARERFTIEIGWSIDGKYRCGPTTSNPEDSSTEPAISFRLSRLWERGGKEKWWELTKQMPDNTSETLSPEEFIAQLMNDDFIQDGLKNIGPIIEEVFALISEYAIPYFDRILETKE